MKSRPMNSFDFWQRAGERVRDLTVEDREIYTKISVTAAHGMAYEMAQLRPTTELLT